MKCELCLLCGPGDSTCGSLSLTSFNSSSLLSCFRDSFFPPVMEDITSPSDWLCFLLSLMPIPIGTMKNKNAYSVMKRLTPWTLTLPSECLRSSLRGTHFSLDPLSQRRSEAAEPCSYRLIVWVFRWSQGCHAWVARTVKVNDLAITPDPAFKTKKGLPHCCGENRPVTKPSNIR